LTEASAVLLIGFFTLLLVAGASDRFSKKVSSLDTVAQSLPNPKKSSTIPQPQSTPSVPPAPEQLQPPSAIAVPINGKLSIRLINRTGAKLIYQIISDTKERTLPGRTNINLQALKIPKTITFYRQDRELLRVRPQSSPGLLTVTFTETTDLGFDKTVMMIERSGSVYLN